MLFRSGWNPLHGNTATARVAPGALRTTERWQSDGTNNALRLDGGGQHLESSGIISYRLKLKPEASSSKASTQPVSGHKYRIAGISGTRSILPQSCILLKNRQQKKIASTPSEMLAAALENGGYAFAVPPKVHKKNDYSHTSPVTEAPTQKKETRSGPYKSKSVGSLSSRLTLPSVLAKYIAFIPAQIDSCLALDNFAEEDSQIDNDILQVFDTRTVCYLRSKGYDAGDVMSWAWILTTPPSERAAARLIALSDLSTNLTGSAVNPVPTFVFLFLLRRESLPSPALRLLTLHAWDRLNNQSSSSRGAGPRSADISQSRVQISKQSWYTKMSEPTIVTMVIRLLRHARSSWSAALVSIVTILTTHVNGNDVDHCMPESVKLKESVSARLSLIYNRILSLLSLPSAVHPFLSVPHHQQAQFVVLRRMNSFEPALTITVDGYRAVTKVQLAHRKTAAEREWAKMKAVSWPPWKEERLGLDSEKGIEMGISRAKESLSRHYEAGYAPKVWEAAAGILSGWDTDCSPTIQTRTVFPRRLGSSAALSSKVESASDVWASRIRSTRTVHEAWASFLSYRDRNIPLTQEVFYAMSEKIVFENIRKRKEARSVKIAVPPSGGISRHISLPGDAMEPSASPRDPRGNVYIREISPSMEDFFTEMIKDGIKPCGRFLNFLISHADSIGAGIRYLESSSLPSTVIQVLLAEDAINSVSQESHAILKSLPNQLFTAYLKLLCRFHNRASSPSLFGDMDVKATQQNLSIRFRNPVIHAYRLLQISAPKYLPAWYSLLSALTYHQSQTYSDSNDFRTDIASIARWKYIMDLIDQMNQTGLRLDFQGFHIILVGLERAIVARQRITTAIRPRNTSFPKGVESPETSSPVFNDWDRQEPDTHTILQRGPYKAKQIFRDIVGVDSHAKVTRQLQSKPPTPLPRLLQAPAAAQLHTLVRVLGVANDCEGILEVVEWMVRYASEIQDVVNEMSNGPRQMRSALIAARVFLERSWEQPVDRRQNGMHRASVETMTKVRQAIETVEDWGGWPTDEEVATYCDRGRSSWNFGRSCT